MTVERWAALVATRLAGVTYMSRQVEPFVLAVVLALVAAWLLTLRVILFIGERGQRAGVWIATIFGTAVALGFAGLIVSDLAGPARTITGTVQSVGDPPAGEAERQGAPAYLVVVDGITYGVSRTDHARLRVGNHIRGLGGAAFNYLLRVDVVH